MSHVPRGLSVLILSLGVSDIVCLRLPQLNCVPLFPTPHSVISLGSLTLAMVAVFTSWKLASAVNQGSFSLENELLNTQELVL